MAQIRKPKDAQWKKIQDRLRDRYDTLFSGKEEPPTDMSLRQVEALKARLAELETRLTHQGSLPGQIPPSAGRPEVPQTLPIKPAEGKSEGRGTPATAENRQQRIGLWAAGLFTLLSGIFAGIEFYSVLFVQQGRFEFTDTVLMPLMVVVIVGSLLSYLLIRGGRYKGGSELLFIIVMTLPVVVMLVINNFLTLGILYTVVFAPLMFIWVLPKTARRHGIVILLLMILAMIGIEIWNPGFRGAAIPVANNIIPVAIILAVLALIGFIIRQFPNLSLRPKVIMALVGITVLTVGIIGYYLLNQIYQNSYNTIATQITTENNEHILSIQTFLSEHSQDVMILSHMPDLNKLITDQQTGADPAMIAADTATLKQDLQAFFDSHPVYDNVRFIDAHGQEVTKVTANYITPILQNKSARPFFAIPSQLPAGSLYLSPLELEQDMGKILVPNVPVVRFATPVYYNDKLAGVVVANIVAKNFLSVLNDPYHHMILVDQKGYYLYDNQQPKKLFGGTTDLNTGYTFSKDFPKQAAALVSGKPGSFSDQQNVFFYAPITIMNGTTPSWFLLYEIPQSEIYALANRTLTTSLLILGAILLVAIAVAVYLGNSLTAPLISLTHTAQEAEQGNLAVQSNIKSKDEIGTLASAFNRMTSQLRELIGSLEQRVADRTHDLELASEVGRAVSEKTADLYSLLNEAVELIRERFNLYYTQIYLLDPAGHGLVLRAGTGEVGAQLIRRGHRLPVNSGSLNGRAASEKTAVIVADTTQSASFLPNPLLPETRSEMAVPLLAGNQVLGVLDMQSEQPQGLNEVNLPAFEALAGELAVAIQNAALFAETRQARAEVEDQVRRLTEHGWQDFLDAIERGQKIGYVYDQAGVAPLRAEASGGKAAEAMQAPILVTGAKVGEIRVAEDPDHPLTSSQIELVKATAAQLGQHIENLRLLAQTERYREQAEQVARRLTREGWETLQAQGDVAPGYVYNLNEVKPLTGSDRETSAKAIWQPLVVRNEAIGKLEIELDARVEGADEIVSAVAQQLSSQIENLRLSELNERHAQQEHTLRQITSSLRSSTNPETILRTAVRELGNILGRKMIVQMKPPEKGGGGNPQ